jgi:DNA mismatch endonuclease (patch repair protein)
MADVFTKAKRSEVMARIRSCGNTNTELALIRIFRAERITGWRRQLRLGEAARQRRPTFRVKPDFVFPKLKLAVFVDGCFWHACPKHATKPRSNAAFWRKKFASNKARDRLVTRTLRRAGWRVLRLWEHELAKRSEAHLRRRIWRALVQPPTGE